MPINKLLISILSLAIIHCSYAWGPTGHRVVGKIASEYLNEKATAEVKRILGYETLAEVSTYMDFIRSDKQFDYLYKYYDLDY